MVIKTTTCEFSDNKIYPGHGMRYCEVNGKTHMFLNKKVHRFYKKKQKSRLLNINERLILNQN